MTVVRVREVCHYSPPGLRLGLPADWKRLFGWPSHTWLRAVEADLGQLDIGLASAWRKAAIREDWRRTVDTATLQRSMLWKKKKKKKSYNYLPSYGITAVWSMPKYCLYERDTCIWSTCRRLLRGGVTVIEIGFELECSAVADVERELPICRNGFRSFCILFR